ncbi:MAG TPA: Crp/Fnr family transcriptional regulator [Actinomycetota bacterium]|nr:Crp/Fnr family transcriptional regulator [Actinomycetota bacterium]
MGGEVLAAGVAPRRYRHGEVILGQGRAVTCLRLVLSGSVRLSAVAPSGREVVVALLGPGDVFGELALLGGGPSPVEARAVGDQARIVALHVGTLREIVRRAPSCSEELLRLVAARLHRTTSALEEALAHDVRERVSLRLRELARSHGTVAPQGVALPPRLTQDEIARMVGATRESVNRTLSILSARGLVRLEDRRYVLPDPEALVPATDR